MPDVIAGMRTLLHIILAILCIAASWYLVAWVCAIVGLSGQLVPILQLIAAILVALSMWPMRNWRFPE